jgi:hypothetical protein
MTRREWFAFKKETTRFRIMNRHLFRNNTKNVSFRKIINLIEQQREIIKALHDKNEHRGIKNIYRRITDRY